MPISEQQIISIILFGKKISQNFDEQMRKGILSTMQDGLKLTQDGLAILIKELNSILNEYKEQITEEAYCLMNIADEITNFQVKEQNSQIIDFEDLQEQQQTLKNKNHNTEQCQRLYNLDSNHQKIEQDTNLNPKQIPEAIESQTENYFQLTKLQELQLYLSIEIIKNQKDQISNLTVGFQESQQLIFKLQKQFLENLYLYQENNNVQELLESEKEYNSAIQQITKQQNNQTIDLEIMATNIKKLLQTSINFIKDIQYQYACNQQIKLKQIKTRLVENQLILNNFKENLQSAIYLYQQYNNEKEQLVEKQNSLEQDFLIAQNKLKVYQKEVQLQNQQAGYYKPESEDLCKNHYNLEKLKNLFGCEVKKWIFQLLQTTIQNILQEETSKLEQSEKQNFKDYEQLKNEFQTLHVLEISQELEQLRQLLNSISQNQVIASKTIQYSIVLKIFQELISDKKFM